jgi:hypothetical protein
MLFMLLLGIWLDEPYGLPAINRVCASQLPGGVCIFSKEIRTRKGCG